MITNLDINQISPADVLERAQDDLLARLTGSGIPLRRMEAALAQHIATLTGAGFKASEARASFFEAVSTYKFLEAEGAL